MSVMSINANCPICEEKIPVYCATSGAPGAVVFTFMEGGWADLWAHLWQHENEHKCKAADE